MTLSIEDATRFAQVFKGLVDGVSVASWTSARPCDSL